MMRGSAWGIGAVVLGALSACSGNEPGPGSKIGAPEGGSAGTGQAGALNLEVEAGRSGGGAGGASTGGAGAAAGGAAGNADGGLASTSAGSNAGGSTGGVTGSAGGGTGGGKPAGMCARAAGNDADCADFWAEEGYTQAHACSSLSAAAQLPRTLGKACASVSFVAGAAYGMCCMPAP